MVAGLGQCSAMTPEWAAPGHGSHVEFPLALTIGDPAGWLEAVRSVEVVRAVVVFVCPEADPRAVPLPCLRDSGVEELSADSFSPAWRNDVEIAEEPLTWASVPE